MDSGSDGSWMLREKMCTTRASCGSLSDARTWCTRSASVLKASGLSASKDWRLRPMSTFSSSSRSTLLKNPLRKSVARMCRVATSSSLRVATASEGQTMSSAMTLLLMSSSCGRMSSVKPRSRYVRKLSVFTWQATNSRYLVRCSLCAICGAWSFSACIISGISAGMLCWMYRGYSWNSSITISGHSVSTLQDSVLCSSLDTLCAFSSFTCAPPFCAAPPCCARAAAAAAAADAAAAAATCWSWLDPPGALGLPCAADAAAARAADAGATAAAAGPLCCEVAPPPAMSCMRDAAAPAAACEAPEDAPPAADEPAVGEDDALLAFAEGLKTRLTLCGSFW